MQGDSNAARRGLPAPQTGKLILRAAVLALLLAVPAAAWVESVEFPFETYPQQLWERELAWLKNVGITHVSLSTTQGSSHDPALLNEVIRILRALGMEADLEGPIPPAMQALTREHGGPLTGPISATPISALSPDAIIIARRALEAGATALVWKDVEDTLGPSGYRAGAVNFAGVERPSTIPLRRNAQLAGFWSHSFSDMKETPGAGPRLGPVPTALSMRQFTSDAGTSIVSVINRAATPWTGDLRVLYPVLKRTIGIPAVTVPARNSVWLPVNLPLPAGFAATDHLVYATAELTAMEYENGILAMEFAAPSAGEVVVQLSREPYGPFIAGGKPTSFDWDDHEHRARLTIPAGTGPAAHVRIGLAIEPPDSTGFFDNARVLLIGETNHLTAQYSSAAIAQRSRVRTSSGLTVAQSAGADPLHLAFDVRVPETAVHGDHADLAIDADGTQISHARPQLLRPASLSFPEQIEVRVAADSAVPLYPATVPVNQRTGREITVSVRNNAPEIRNFTLELKVPGVDFLPARLDVSVGASMAREVTFRVFTRTAETGIHTGDATLSGAAKYTAPLRILVVGPDGATVVASNGFQILESARTRAVFYAAIPASRWLEFTTKDTGKNALPAGGVPFIPSTIERAEAALRFGNGRTLGLSELERLAPPEPQRPVSVR